MAKELTDIIKAAADVRDETVMQKNTATRVGGVLTERLCQTTQPQRYMPPLGGGRGFFAVLQQGRQGKEPRAVAPLNQNKPVAQGMGGELRLDSLRVGEQADGRQRLGRF